MIERVDHLIYAVPDLDAGTRRVEALLGVRPAVGGRHPAFGTYNALLSLGPSTYLEVMAPDPSLGVPERGVLFGLDRLESPRLLTWVLRAEDVEARALRARAQGVPLGDVQHGQREQRDGTVLSWRATDPFAFPSGGVVPFLIAWGAAPHPAATAPPAGRLVDLEVRHPDPDAVVRAFGALEVELRVAHAARPGLVATIDVGGRSVILT